MSAFEQGTPFISSFGELVAQEETPIVTAAFPYNINTAYVTATTANGGTVTQANSQAVIQTSTASNGSSTLESLASARYSPGQGMLWRGTAAFTLGVANSQQEIGIGDSTDGFFFGYQGATFGIFRRQNGSDTFIAKADWNGPDRLPSLDPTKGNVYQIRYQWLGYGAIRFYIENAGTGDFVLVHTIYYPNTVVVPSIFNPNLPLHAKAVNSGNATNITILVGSMGVYAEGPQNQDGARFSTGNRKVNVTTEISIFAIQNVTSFASHTNRSRVHVDSVGSAFVGGGDGQYRMVLNPTLGGTPSFADIATNQSIVQVDTAGTTVTGGREIRRGVNNGGGSSLQEDISNLQIRLNPGDILVMAGSSNSGGITINLSLSWREEL